MLVQECAAGLIPIRSTDGRLAFAAPPLVRSGPVDAELVAQLATMLRLDPDEIVLGNMPQLSLGMGSRVMEYLDDDERITGFFGTLNEYSATGHNVPDYPLLLAKGILDGSIPKPAGACWS